jgi:hypothetical protein
MKKFTLINNITGWITFLIASFVYLSTIEPTSSFWDCGEFIASSFKLEVGHPPGAPFFMLFARFFTLFAGNDTTRVALMVNALSGLASAFTIMFLFWTITHLARKIIVSNDDYSIYNYLVIIGSGLTGALAYTFTDTFWFSAVEGEVYATSSLFTAIVFWAILKWENVADEPYSNRWLIFIAYLMGLSIGVHLLNLLAIPAIILVYYFKKYEVTRSGVIKALIIAAVVLGGIIYVIVPGTVIIANQFELFFVNILHLPYMTGALFYGILIIGLLVLGLHITRKNNNVLANTILTGLTVILIGYSTYATIIIRSKANPPMDQNNPETLFSLLYYLNREQYGDRPLIRGQYFNAPFPETKKGRPIYTPIKGRYVKTHHRRKYVYDKNYITLLPRMWSSESNHVNAYIQWAGLDEKDLYESRIDNNGKIVRDREGNIVYDRQKAKNSPTFIQNLKFLFRYQLGHMYFRYFMWNFAGRQNDIQGHGYDQYGSKDIINGNWISGIKFIDEIRLGNQDNLPESLTQNKARNKYYFLPLILGLLGMIFHYNNNKKDFWIVMILFFMTGIAIVFYLNQYPYQPRERDYAYAGSFYSFAIWIGFSVAALADRIKKILPSQPGAFIALVICFLAGPVILAMENCDDHNRSGRYFARDFANNYLNSCAPNAILFTNGDNDTFPLWYAQEVEGIRTDIRVVNLSYLGADWYIEQMERRAYESAPLPMTLTKDKYRSGSRDIVYIIERLTGYSDLKLVIDFLADDNPDTKRIPNVGELIDYFPNKRFSIRIDSAKVIDNGTIRAEMADRIVPSVNFTLNKRYLTKNHLMVLDFLATNNWNRPIYYAITVASENYLNLDDYFQIHGLAYKIVPIKSSGSYYYRGSVDTEIMMDNMINKFKWGGIEDSSLYLDENILRMLSNFRNNFARLASALIEENKPDSAKIVLDKCVKLMPDNIVRFDVFNLAIIENYYRLGETEKANSMLIQLSDNVCDDLEYYISLEDRFETCLSYEKRLGMHVLGELTKYSSMYNQEELSNDLRRKFEKYAAVINISMF